MKTSTLALVLPILALSVPAFASDISCSEIDPGNSLSIEVTSVGDVDGVPGYAVDVYEKSSYQIFTAVLTVSKGKSVLAGTTNGRNDEDISVRLNNKDVSVHINLDTNKESSVIVREGVVTTTHTFECE